MKLKCVAWLIAAVSLPWAARAGMDGDLSDTELEREWVSETEFQFILPETERLPIGTLKYADDLILEYAGQATYTVAPNIFRGGEQHSDDRFDVFDGTEIEDEYGRLWRIAEVSANAVLSAREWYDDRVINDVGLESYLEDSFGNPGGEDDKSFEEVFGTNYSWIYYPNAWTIWNFDSRVQFANPPTNIQNKVLVYHYGSAVNNNAGRCSATLIDIQNNGRFASTAAHCVKDDYGNWIYPRGWICRNGNKDQSSKCAKVTSRFTNGWASGPRGRDYALLKANNGSQIGGGYMALSNASNNTIKSSTHIVSGYPAWLPTITSSSNPSSHPRNVGPNPCDPTSDNTSSLDTNCTSSGFQSSGTANYTTAQLLGVRIDAMSGNSGGPIYYVSGGGHYMTGILSGTWVATNLSRYNGGPKVPGNTRDWFITIMANNQ